MQLWPAGFDRQLRKRKLQKCWRDTMDRLFWLGFAWSRHGHLLWLCSQIKQWQEVYKVLMWQEVHRVIVNKHKQGEFQFPYLYILTKYYRRIFYFSFLTIYSNLGFSTIYWDRSNPDDPEILMNKYVKLSALDNNLHHDVIFWTANKCNDLTNWIEEAVSDDWTVIIIGRSDISDCRKLLINYSLLWEDKKTGCQTVSWAMLGNELLMCMNWTWSWEGTWMKIILLMRKDNELIAILSWSWIESRRLRVYPWRGDH